MSLDFVFRGNPRYTTPPLAHNGCSRPPLSNRSRRRTDGRRKEGRKCCGAFLRVDRSNRAGHSKRHGGVTVSMAEGGAGGGVGRVSLESKAEGMPQDAVRSLGRLRGPVQPAGCPALAVRPPPEVYTNRPPPKHNKSHTRRGVETATPPEDVLAQKQRQMKMKMMNANFEGRLPCPFAESADGAPAHMIENRTHTKTRTCSMSASLPVPPSSSLALFPASALQITPPPPPHGTPRLSRAG